MLKRKLRKMTSLILAFGMIVSLTPSSVWAEGTPTDSPVIEGSSEETTETTEAATEVETTEATTEATTEQQPTDKTEIIPTFDKIYNDVNVDGLDFGSCELLIATEDASIFTADTEVVSEYDGVFLTRYPDAEQTKSAYTYYYDKADMVDVNSKIKINDNESDNKDDTEEVAEDDEDVPQQETTIENSDEAITNEGHGEADLTNINKEDESLANLNEIDKIKDYSGFIALIDTGAKKENNVKESISLIGDKADDDNGHGTKMVEAITSVNKDAKILSIKALDKDGTGNVSDVYAAINYAIDAKVSVINLSMSSIQTAESQLLKEAIEDAVSKDIIVVVSAGNNGKKAKYYTPANIEKAYTIGAADKDGNILSTSNYGDVVDYYVVAESTSEASAIFSGYASISIDEAIKNTIELKKTEEETIETDEIEETEEASETDAEENIQHDENGFMLHVNSIPDSDAAPWYSLGSSGGYELWRSKNMGHDATTEGNRTWWYLGWYNGNAIKWSAKAYCLDPDKQAPPSTGSASIIYDGAGVNITKAYFWSKADLMQYYTDGQTIYEEGDPKSNNHSQYNINWLGMGNDRTSNLLRYASSGSATYGRTDTVTYGNAVADYNTVTSYKFPSSTAEYVSWDDADLASNAVPNDAAWYEEPVFRNIYIVKAKTTALATGTFSTPSASDWVFNTRYNQMHLKNYITYTGGEDGKSMFIGKVPSGTQFTVHGSGGTTKTFIEGQLFVIYSGDKLDIWVDADSIGTSYTVNEDTEKEHGSRAYGYSVAIRQYTSATQRMGYLNSIQSPSQSFSYSVPNLPRPKVDLEKSSSNPTYTNGNPNYSLAGATFQIYKGTTLVTSLVTDASGNTPAVEIPLVHMDTNSDGDIVDTTFSYKETVTPKGYLNQAKEGYFTVPINDTGFINETNTGGADFIDLTISKQDSTGSDD